MSGHWLDILDPDVDAAEVRNRVEARMAARRSVKRGEDPEALVDALWNKVIERETYTTVSLSERDCDVVPRNYSIDWRIPILGPIHAVVRRVINAEIRRYLSRSLQRQSYLNRRMLRALDDLTRENERLHREIERLQEDRG